MKIFGFAGWSGSGKTTLIEQLIPRFVKRGLRVSMIKHAHHSFDVDQPGKDSYRHRQAGCSEVMVVSDRRWVIMHELRGEPEPSLEDQIECISPCDLLLVEGHKHHPLPKLEIWRKVSQKIPAGSTGKALAPGTAARIFTGAPIPGGADAIVMQEDCAQEGDEVVVKKVPARGEWIRLTGSDIRAGGEVLPAGLRLRPQDTGLAASVGIASLPVRRRVRLGLFFTGDELVMPGDPLASRRVYNSNRFTLNGLAGIFGCETRDYGIVPDSLPATRGMLGRAAAECDVIVTSGGVSVGEADFVKPAVEAEGELLMWKIAMKPGRPLAFGRVGKATFIGQPGNPVSSFVTFLIFVRPFLLKTQ